MKRRLAALASLGGMVLAGGVAVAQTTTTTPPITVPVTIDLSCDIGDPRTGQLICDRPTTTTLAPSAQRSPAPAPVATPAKGRTTFTG